MRIEDYFDFRGPDEMLLKGHRIGIEHYNAGFSPEQIAEAFPGLSLEQVHTTITYCLHFQAEVDAYIKRQEARCGEQYREWATKPSPVIQRLRMLIARHAQQPV